MCQAVMLVDDAAVLYIRLDPGGGVGSFGQWVAEKDIAKSARMRAQQNKIYSYACILVALGGSRFYSIDRIASCPDLGRLFCDAFHMNT